MSTHTTTDSASTSLIALSVLTMVVAATGYHALRSATHTDTLPQRQEALLMQFSKDVSARFPAAPTDPALQRVAERLQKRVTARFAVTPSVDALASAIEDRAALLTRSTLVQFAVTGEGKVPETPFVAAAAERAHWIVFSLRGSKPSFAIDSAVIANDIRDADILQLPHAADGTAVPAPDAWSNPRMTLSGVPSSGYVYEPDAVATSIADALTSGSVSATVTIAYHPAGVVLPDGRRLELLSTGHSDFATSPAGRKANVRKGLEERLHGVVIPAGKTFSFNSILGRGVSRASGWQDSLVIKDGYRLVPEPGGGICQVATTFYRAALLAGLPIPTRKNHSLFVHYYEKYGVGLDATIYIGAQDLKAVNDTGNDLFVQAYVNGTDAVVNIYGIADGRTIEMAGPYFTANAPADLTSKPLRANEIGWTRTVRRTDGHEQRDVILSRYKSIPRAVAPTYTSMDVVAEMHSAAPLPVNAVAVQ